ncbi:FAD-dependent oxidoreductase [Trinickia caryophylli]|uniref:Tryptophan 2-monooxygenase n=2 Tax=Trinickia caryophylli TaxID=28094 RepID=A0A1X7EE08_TRICW|nr:FAD-dependent oxidoreductase [Trinickia caryophylli]GLU32140.1 hypothetical protein Busp01_19820 [Trinickia caryophylli]SMF32236.1 Flavin containing amine oxidoreductase [Trinickia caryophylli]
MESVNTNLPSTGAEHATLERPESSGAAAARRPSSSTLPEVEGATRRSAIRTEGSPRAPTADLSEVSKRARVDHADSHSGWPENRVDTAFSGPAERAKNAKRSGRAQLSTQGRELPPLTPQALGHYFKDAVGTWPPRERSSLVSAMTNNLRKLAELKQEPEIKQMRRELTLHWHALSEAEKSDVLEAAGTASKELGKSKMSKPADNANVQTWLEHTAAHMPSADVRRLVDATSTDARASLDGNFRLAGTDDTRRAEVKQQSADMHMTLPLDHMYDYTGFYWDNNRKIGHLPKDVAQNLKVCVIGAGPAGIMAADCLNRLGVKPTVLEAADHIGGRLATHHRVREDGTESPTATHPGGMRFHTTHGNFYWSFAEHYKLPHIDFTNPAQVGATLLLTDRVLRMEPGKEPADPVAKQVKDDFLRASESLLKPLREAREAGDTAKFLELSAAAKKKFDGLTFKEGVELLLAENGIHWDEEHWKTFGAVGIGVGGYKGYYNTGFLEEMRFLVDGRLENHQLLVDGADEPLKRMIADKEGLPPGTPSLAEQGAIKLSSPAMDIEKTAEGKFKVTWKEDGKETKSETYDEVFFGASPKIAVDMGLTKADRPGGQLVTPEIATALESINLVGATKMTMTVPADEFHPEQLPKNLQSTAEFQQLYLHAPAKEGNSAVIYLSYTLGDNAKKVEGKSKEEQIRNLLDTLHTAADRDTTPPEDKAQLRNLAALIDKHWEARSHYTHWTEEPNHQGAFKMDAPGDLDNTRKLWNNTLAAKPGIRVVHEKATYEGGFASGPFAAVVNSVAAMVESRGGTVAKNSPLGQRIL